MDTFPALPLNRRRELCLAASATLGLDAATIEKDFWVCWTLRELFDLPGIGQQLTFKGGTSLSKGWKIIERFSEYIDVVIDRESLGFGGTHAPERAPSSKKRNAGIDALKAAASEHVRNVLAPALQQSIQQHLPHDQPWRLTEDSADPDAQTLLFEYPAAFPGRPYLRTAVKIELGARSDTDPSATPEIQPYLAEALSDELGPSTFTVRTVAPERTFWEKAMLLHEETFRESTGPKARLARHYYGLWCLIRAGIVDKALADPTLFGRIVAHRVVYFRKSKAVTDTLKPATLRLLPADNQRTAWAQDYQAMRDTMFFGDAPTFNEILRAVGDFEKRFNQASEKSGCLSETHRNENY